MLKFSFKKIDRKNFLWMLQILSSRQRTAFPPNFVHSLDSSHMMMTAVACKRAGLNFAGLSSWITVLCRVSHSTRANCCMSCVISGVHDSYWTHACDVDEMNRILREKFVELYETPILENVRLSLPHISFWTLWVAGSCLVDVYSLNLFVIQPRGKEGLDNFIFWNLLPLICNRLT